MKWDALNLSGLDLSLQPNALQLQEIKWQGLQTSIIIGPDHRANVQMILSDKPARQATPVTNSTASAVSNAPAPSAAFPDSTRRLGARQRRIPFRR